MDNLIETAAPKAEKGAFKKNLGKLFRFMAPWKWWFFPAFVFAVGTVVLSIIGPNLVSRMVDYIVYFATGGTRYYMDIWNAYYGVYIRIYGEFYAGIQGGTHMDVVAIAVTLIIMYVVLFVAGYAQEFLISTGGRGVVENMRQRMSEKLNRLPLGYFDKNQTGDVLSRITNDVDQIQLSIAFTTSSVFQGALLLVGTTIMMFYTDWALALIAIGTSLISFAIMAVIMGSSQKYFEAQRVELGLVNGHIEEYFAGHTVVKVNNSEKRTAGEFEKLNKQLYGSDWKSQFYGGLAMPLMMFVSQLTNIFVIVLGGVFLTNGRIESIGVIIAFSLYVGLFTRPLGDLAQAGMDLQNASAASGRIFEVLEETEMAAEDGFTTSKTLNDTSVSFENVKFSYVEGKPIIHNFSADVKPGQTVAIVGPTGAGKTTMINILMKFYELDGGDIKIGGVSTKEMTRGQIAEQFSMVLQDAWVFDGTIRENLIYNMSLPADLEQEILDNACEVAGLSHFIKTLPDGYETRLDERASISEGQRQLLTIARAIIKNAPLIILDEATSSVDTRTEVLVKKAMDKLAEGRTSFVIAHRLSTIKNADLILVMRDGDIVESGTHEQLLDKGGFYFELANAK